MITNILLDAGIVGRLCHAKQKKNRPVVAWLDGIVAGRRDVYRVYLPETADYEIRRKLLQMIANDQAHQTSIDRLDRLAILLEYLPITTPVMRRAAEFWASARLEGVPAAHDLSLDADMILAAQAASIDATVITANRKHLFRFVRVADWTEVN